MAWKDQERSDMIFKCFWTKKSGSMKLFLILRVFRVGTWLSVHRLLDIAEQSYTIVKYLCTMVGDQCTEVEQPFTRVGSLGTVTEQQCRIVK